MAKMRQRVKRTPEQVAASKLDPSIRPSAYDKEQYTVATFAGRGKAKATKKGY